MADGSYCPSLRFCPEDLTGQALAELTTPSPLPISGGRITSHLSHPANGDLTSIAELVQESQQSVTHCMEESMQLELFIRANLLIVQGQLHCMPTVQHPEQRACIFWPKGIQVARKPSQKRDRVSGHLGNQPFKCLLRLLRELLWIELINDRLEQAAKRVELVVKGERERNRTTTLGLCLMSPVFAAHPPGLVDCCTAGSDCNDDGCHCRRCCQPTYDDGQKSGQCGHCPDCNGSPISPVSPVRSLRAYLESHNPSLLEPILPRAACVCRPARTSRLFATPVVHVFALAGFAAGSATLLAISRACRAARNGLRWCWRRCAHG